MKFLCNKSDAKHFFLLNINNEWIYCLFKYHEIVEYNYCSFQCRTYTGLLYIHSFYLAIVNVMQISNK